MWVKSWSLRLHRWIALISALPLLGVVLTGLVLSFEPIAVTGAIKSGSLSIERTLGFLATHDPSNTARSLSIRSYDGVFAFSDSDGERTDINLVTGDKIADGTFLWADIFGFARGAHETLLFEEGWLVEASTWAMLILAPIGLLMGFARPRNTPGGWHKVGAWVFLPLLVLSPVTGLMIAYGVTFTTPPQGPRPQPISLVEAVKIIGSEKDLSTLVWLRTRGGRLVARVVEDGEYRVYGVSAAGLQATQRNWPRLLHEGNWGGAFSGWLNVALSAVILMLMGTGLWIWGKRKLRVRRPRQRASAQIQPAE
jgi:hypothetical protein